MAQKATVGNIDRLGTGISTACAVHCALMPFATTVLPLLGLEFLADSRIERTVLLTSTILAAGSICWGFRLHRRLQVPMVFSAGLLMVLTGHAVDEALCERVLVVIGATLFVGGHLLNQHFCRECVDCSHPPVHLPE